MTRHRSPSAPDRGAATWDAWLPGDETGFYLSHDWLTSLRGTKGYTDETWAAHDAGGLAALVPVYTADRPLNIQLYDLAYLFGEASPAVGSASAAWDPQTLIGSRSGYVNAPLVRDASVLPAWAEAAAAAVQESGCASAAVPYLERDVARELSDLLPGPLLLSGGRCRLRVRGADFDEHLAALPKPRRKTVKGDLRAFARGDCSIETRRLDESIVADLAPLLVNVQHRYGSSVQLREVTNYLRACAMLSLQERSVLFVCRRGEEVVGFCLAFHYGSTLTIRVVGLDYERTGQHSEYFSLLVHEPVRYATEHGIACVDLGSQGYHQKLLRGADMVPLWSLLLKSPIDWDRRLVEEHNDGLVREWAESMGVQKPDLAARLRMEEV